MNISLLKNIRKLILGIATLWAVCAFFIFDYDVLIRAYALSSLFFLYVSVLVTPLYLALPQLPYKAIAVKGRRGTGVSAFLFASLHATMAFIYSLGGLNGVLALTGNAQLAFFSGLAALLILLLMTLTSLDYMVKTLGKYWKPLHRFVYLAGYLILIHAAAFGTDFLGRTIISHIVYGLVVILLSLEANRIIVYLTKKNEKVKPYRLLLFSLILILLLLPLVIRL
jgi:DMSO/TMAO reductase YedYZ heme-binding membrane subunit